jgi:hypothetical protein
MLPGVKRIVPAGKGYVVIDYSGKGWGHVEIYDAEGWELDGAVWGMRGYPPDAGDILAERTDLDPADIARITDESRAQYEARGGDSATKAPMPKEGWIFFAGLAFVALVIVVGLAALIAWLLL